MQINLTRIHRSTTDKQGNPLKSKDGRPYTRLGIQCQEHGSEWLSGFGAYWNENWREGDTVEVEIKPVQGKDGKTYLNFSKPDPLAELLKQVNALAVRVSNLERGTQVQTVETVSDNDPSLPF